MQISELVQTSTFKISCEKLSAHGSSIRWDTDPFCLWQQNATVVFSGLDVLGGKGNTR